MILPGLLLLVAAQDGGPAPLPGPSPDEVDAVLRALEPQSAAVAAAPAPELEVPHADLPPRWWEMVEPVLALRLRPVVRLGHPTSQRRPEGALDLRGWVGATLHPVPGLSARLVLAVHPSFPALEAPGPDALLDGWVEWAYPALGGTVALRAGRQEIALTELTWARQDWLQRPPRFDGATARLTVGRAFLVAVLAAEALWTLPVAGEPPDVNVVAALQSGFSDGPGRLLELHAVLRAPRVAAHGDRTEGLATPARLFAGGNAEWTWMGLHGRAALDVEQEQFERPSVFAPPVVFHAEGGYAPHFPWAFGAYASAGARGGLGQPMSWLPGAAGGWSGFDGVAAQDAVPLYGTVHGAYGEMDLARSTNAYALFARAGLVRDRLQDLSFTLWRLAQWDARGAWYPAAGDSPLLAPGEGRPTPLIGWEADLSARAQLTDHLVLSGAVGLLYAGSRARDAQFTSFAQTAWGSLEFRL
ncbi:MAG: hypothetical protein HY904_11335 [Deltaproteobacteria bacterium]|nr:hypothetical protein [Deltaproteobacteria bacterium]